MNRCNWLPRTRGVASEVLDGSLVLELDSNSVLSCWNFPLIASRLNFFTFHFNSNRSITCITSFNYIWINTLVQINNHPHLLMNHMNFQHMHVLIRLGVQPLVLRDGFFTVIQRVKYTFFRDKFSATAVIIHELVDLWTLNWELKLWTVKLWSGLVNLELVNWNCESIISICDCEFGVKHKILFSRF